MDDPGLPPDLQRWTLINCSFLTPSDWRIAAEQDDTGYAIVPPAGEGRLVLSGVTDTQPPPFDRKYALDLVVRGMRSLGFESDTYRFDPMADDHYRAIGESHLRDRFVIGAAHAFAPGYVVIAYYHSTLPDQNRATVWSILNSIQPNDTD